MGFRTWGIAQDAMSYHSAIVLKRADGFAQAGIESSNYGFQLQAYSGPSQAGSLVLEPG